MTPTAFLLAASLLLSSLPADAQVTAFVDGRVIDGAGHVIERGTVVVRDGVIEEVGATASVRVPQGATRIDLRGKTLMPGLVNAHGHLAPVDGLKTGPEYYTRDNLLTQLRAYAAYGVTTVFSLGDDQAEARDRDDAQLRPLCREREPDGDEGGDGERDAAGGHHAHVAIEGLHERGERRLAGDAQRSPLAAHLDRDAHELGEEEGGG